ncbi:hypothetical protein F5884DRAFT_547085 [Xylogone sp. PMI_703]|nr:hypothetical protein F5884DRAFT_547085 [Xylogone sp. PMI_703]
MTLAGYRRSIAKRKGYSDDPEVIAERLLFCQDAVAWSSQRIYKQRFSDEVWTYGGWHNIQFVTKKTDGSEDYFLETTEQRRTKGTCWWIWGMIRNGKQGPLVFWNKDWGHIDSEKTMLLPINHVLPPSTLLEGVFHIFDGHVTART